MTQHPCAGALTPGSEPPGNTARSYMGLHRALLRLVFLVLASSLIGGCGSVTQPTTSSTPSPAVTPVALGQPTVVPLCGTTVRVYPLPSSMLLPTQLTTGPDGNLWIIEAATTATQGAPKDSFLGRLTPPTIQQFPVPFNLAGLNGLTAGPDGNLWYVRYGKVGRLTPSGQVHEFPLPEKDSNVTGITAGPDGNLWFTESRADSQHPLARVGRITPDGHFQEFAMPTPNSDAGGITVGPDGNLWFTMSSELEHEVALVGRITPDGVVSEFPIANPTSHLNKILAGPDGNLWFTEAVASPDGQHTIGTLGRITPEGTLREFVVPGSGDHVLEGLAVGLDGNLWFTDLLTLGNITPSGTISVCAAPSIEMAPLDITRGPDGHLWVVGNTPSGGFVGQVG